MLSLSLSSSSLTSLYRRNVVMLLVALCCCCGIARIPSLVPGDCDGCGGSMLVVGVSALSPRSTHRRSSSAKAIVKTTLTTAAPSEKRSERNGGGVCSNSRSNTNDAISSRRELLGSTTANALAVAFAGAGVPWLSSIKTAQAAGEQGQQLVGPIAVIGASGRTGSLCVNACLRRGISVRALTRTGEWKAPPTPDGAVALFRGDASKLLTVSRCDVLQSDDLEIQTALQGCSAVVYAASASKAGGSAASVDNLGVCKVASAAVASGVGRYVVISSTGTSRPKSLGYVFTNLGVGGNIMGEKRNGEVGTMKAYNNSNTNLSYTIVRPGGLEEPKRNKVLGPSVLEISQGDVFAGIISRADVAEATVELALSNSPNVRNTAVELYYTDSVVETEGKFKPLLAATKKTNNNNPLRLHGSTYSELFQGIRPGIDYLAE